MTDNKPVLIVGAGLAGLSCAVRLENAGMPYRLIDKADRPGGRVRTDHVDGFRLDRGFQVLLTAYPEVTSLLDMQALQLHPFRAGALIRRNGSFHRLSDPLRHPVDTFRTLSADIGSLRDKLRILSMRRDVKRAGTDGHHPTGQTILNGLEGTWGFSADMVDGFFRPFLGGITLDAGLNTDLAFFEFVMRMFSEGSAALPAGGMQSLPDQLAARLDPASLMLETEVSELVGNEAVILSDGTRVDGSSLVLATDMTQAAGLDDSGWKRAWNGTTCLYFAADTAPVREPVLVLNAEGRGIINSVVVPSMVAPGYAPDGKHLVGVSCLGIPASDSAETERLVLAELAAWFGTEVADWRHLRTYHLPHSLPSQKAGTLDRTESTIHIAPSGRIVCGDHVTTSSINGALASGREAAETLLATNNEPSHTLS